MSLQAYLDNIKAKTGKTPDDFRELATAKGLLAPGFKAGPLVAWLKEDFSLGHGHAMAIYTVLSDLKSPESKGEGGIEKHFSGSKSAWKPAFDELLNKLKDLGEIQTEPTNTYISLLKGKKKFGIVQIGAKQMDIGIKLKGTEPTTRFEASGNWNAMVTHRVKIAKAEEVDTEILDWLKEAYEKA